MEQGDSLTRHSVRRACHDRVREVCDFQCPHHLISKLVELLKESISQDEDDRYVDLLKEYIRSSKYGIWIQDICYIIELLEIIIKKRLTVPEYQKPFESILELIGIPPLLTKSSDVIYYKMDLEEYFTTLGKMFLYLPEDRLQLMLMKSITSILKRKKNSPICWTNLHKCKEAIEDSQLPEIFTSFLVIASKNVYDEFLKVFYMIAKISDIICRKMVKEDAVSYLLMRLEPTWKERLPLQQLPPLPDEKSKICHYKYTSKILWLLIIAAQKGPEDYKKSLTCLKEFPLWSLHYAFRSTLPFQCRNVERNDFVAIMIELTRIFKYVDFVKTGFAQDFAQLAVATEIAPSDPWISKVRFTNSKADYTLKMILLSLLPQFLTLCPNTQILEESDIIRGLLKILSRNQSIEWLPEQHCKLIWISLSVLKMLVPALPEDFAKLNGHLIILNLLKSYQTRSYADNIFMTCCQLLKKLIAVSQPDFVKLIHEHDGTTILLNLLEHLLKKTLTTHRQKATAYIFCAFQRLFQMKSMAQTKIVDINLQYLQRVVEIDAPRDTFIHTQFVVCVLDFLWESVVWSDGNLKEFIDRGGIYYLLDIVETKYTTAKIVAAGILTDISEVEWSIPYFVTWRGKNGKGFLSLLLQIFREVSLLIRVKMSLDGCIEDPEYPIMGELQRELHPNVEPMSSPAICELHPTIRCKIYALFQIIYNRHKEIVRATTEHYALNEKLSITDQMTLLLVENFFALKLGEIWKENLIDIKLSNIEPIPIDQHLLSLLIEKVDKWGSNLKKVQEKMKEDDLKQSEIDEKIFYHKIKEPCLSPALDAFREMECIARCSERMFRLKRKFLHRDQIENHLSEDQSLLHRTYMYEINVTPVFNQSLSIQSNINVKPHKTSDLKPVSPEGSTYTKSFEDKEEILTPPDASEIFCWNDEP